MAVSKNIEDLLQKRPARPERPGPDAPSSAEVPAAAPVEQQEQHETEPQPAAAESTGAHDHPAAASTQDAPAPAQQSQQAIKDPQLQKVESILEEGLADSFRSMDAEHQHMFAVAGEETATAINELLKESKVKVQKILELIKSWLNKIPGINKWFVVQESKIKTDKIIKLKQDT